MSVALMNAWLTPGSVMWAAAGAGFALLLLSGPLSRVAASPRHDGAVRLAKVALFTLIPVLVLIPLLLLFTGENVPGTACGFYLLFFPLFCYYLGRGVGRARGRRELSELVGLEMFDNVADAQDRLYESRQRFATRGEVEASIIALAAAGASSPEVLDVVVEEVGEYDCASSSVG